MRFNPRMEECCAKLEEAQEHELDTYVVQLVRLQSKVDRVSAAFPFSASARPPLSPAIGLYVESFKKELEEFHRNLMIPISKTGWLSTLSFCKNVI